MKLETEIEIKRDSNGNKIATLRPIGRRGFSIQTLGNLPRLHKMQVGDKLHPLVLGDLSGHMKEFASYVNRYGTPSQKQTISDLGFKDA